MHELLFTVIHDQLLSLTVDAETWVHIYRKVGYRNGKNHVSYMYVRLIVKHRNTSMRHDMQPLLNICLPRFSLSPCKYTIYVVHIIVKQKIIQHVYR